VNYKVAIPSAGLGSRIGPHTKFLNKALVTIGDKPAISRVIDKFSSNVPIVVLLGYKGDMIREVLEQLYPDREIDFIDVDLYQGEGSGLGYTLCKAEDYLQSPFIFIANDTIIGVDDIDLNPNYHGNWATYYHKVDADQYNPEVFRTLELSDDEDEIVGITGKGTLNPNIYAGICGVLDYAEFWKAMESKDAIGAGEVFGLRALHHIKPIRIREWYDCGSLQSLEVAKEKFKSGERNILEKEDEAIWFLDEEVVKSPPPARLGRGRSVRALQAVLRFARCRPQAAGGAVPGAGHHVSRGQGPPAACSGGDVTRLGPLRVQRTPQPARAARRA